MKHMKKKNLLSIAAILIAFNGQAQEKLLSIQDAVLKGRTTLAPKRLKGLSIIPQSDSYAYIDDTVLNVYDFNSAKLKTQVTLFAINKSLKAISEDTLKAFPMIEWKGANNFAYQNSKGQELIYSLAEGRADRKEKAGKEAPAKDAAPVGKAFAYSKDNNLFIVSDSIPTQVTFNGSYTLAYGTSVHRDEFGINKGTFWSPQANLLAFYRMDQSDVTDYPIVDWSANPAENKNIKYPMAGSKSHYVSIGIYNLKAKTSIYLNTEGPKDQYLTNIAWSPDENFIYVAILNREQNHMRLNEYKAASGEFVRTLFEEKDEKYVEPLHAMEFVKNNPSQFIWQSRRDGYNHLYLYHVNGKLIRQLTSGKWEVKAFNGFDERGENLFFHANEQSPVNQDFYLVNLKTAKVKRLTQDNGFHSCVQSQRGHFFIDNFTSCYIPREYRVVNVNNGKSSSIFKAENPVKDYKLGRWNLFTIKNNEGSDLYCRMFRPVGFDSTKKYPVLVYLYNGPHSQMVTNSWMAGGELWYHYMAQKGYIVFTLDGRGTSNRGKAFEQAIHRQVGTVEMQDQLKGVEYLKSLPFVDGERLGVHGWSYGGFMTTSLMSRHPGVFKVGAAGGPVIDWSYYEIMYGERYNDSPQENKEGYEKNNLLNHVDKLQGKLLMIHGTQDNVVVWQHSVMYLKKAVEKGVQLDYFVYPGHEHNVLGKDRAHLMEKICNYFLENL
jgi:dipeptidyl-peptidase 4